MKHKRLLSVVLSAALLIGSAVLPQSTLAKTTDIKASAAGSGSISTVRFAGKDRAETATLIANVNKGGMYKTTSTVVIATGFDFHDALAAVPLARAYNAPLLLADRDNLSQKTINEIKRLKTKNVIVVASTNAKDQNGKDAAIRSKVYKQLKGYNITKLVGSSYYETAKKVAQQLQKKKNKAPNYVFFTTNKNYADALSVSPVASILKAPIFYVAPKGKLNANTTYYLNSVKKSISKVFIIGGVNAVSKDVVAKIKAVLPGKTVQRFDGADRYATCVRINNAFKSTLKGKAMCVAKGYNFPDALAGGVFAAKIKAPLFLADKLDKNATLNNVQKNYLKSRKPSKLYVFGGQTAVPSQLINNIKKAAQTSSNRVNTAKIHGVNSSAESKNTVRIYCWNTEFKSYFDRYYPKYGKYKVQTRSYMDYDGTRQSEVVKINGKKIEWILTTNSDNEYQNKLDEAIRNQKNSTNKVDMFLVESDYSQKYVKSNLNNLFALSVKDIGITDNDTKNMYNFTKQLGSDVNNPSELKGLAWSTSTGLFFYDVDIAKKVLGTSDPAKVQNYVKDWNSFKQTAQKMKAKGYKMISSTDDTYHVFHSNMSSAWVKNNKLNIDPQLQAWAKQSREFYSSGYTNKTYQWGEDWQNDMKKGAKVFGFFFPDWGLEYVLKTYAPSGKWKACMGPAGWYWGGSFLCGAVDSDNKDIVADIMKTMTCNTNVAKQFMLNSNYMPNNRAAVNAVSKTYKNSYLGGQNHFALMSKNADRINLKGKLSNYDQFFLYKFTEYMNDYIKGNASYNDSIKYFIKYYIEVNFPEIDTGYGSSQIVKQ